MKNYFTIQELTASETAKRYGIDNTPTPEVKQHLQELTERLLNPIREAWGGPVKVNSGYRCYRLNNLLGGSKTSAHLTGYAADLVPSNGQRAKFIKFVQDYLRKSKLPFDQCINEYDKWCHIGLYNNSKLQRRQIFKIS